MTKSFKRVLAVVLSMAVLASTMLIGAAVTSTEKDYFECVTEFDENYTLSGSKAHIEKFKKVDETGEAGNGYLKFSYAGNDIRTAVIAPHASGLETNSDASIEEGGQVLKPGTTYKITLRIDIDTIGENTVLKYFYAAGALRTNIYYKDNRGGNDGYVVESVTPAVTDGFQDISFEVTTPETYKVLTKLKTGSSSYETEGVNLTVNRFYLGLYDTAKAQVDWTLDSITIKEMVSSDVTFNANGGTFSNDSAMLTATQTLGEPLTVETPVNAGKEFMGWSTDAEGTNIVESVYKLDVTNLYAIWQKSYKTTEVVVDFGDEYTLQGSGNDKFTKNDGYLSYSYNGTTRYNRLVTPNVTGDNNAKSLENGGNGLKAGTTYKVTLRLNITAAGEQTQISYVLAAGNNKRYHAYSNDNIVETSLQTGVTVTDGYQDFVYYITTPEQWPVLEKVKSSGTTNTWNQELAESDPETYTYTSQEDFNYVQNRIFFSIYDGQSTVTCDFDSITIKELYPITYTLDANGGKFADESTTQTVSTFIGETIETPEAPVSTDALMSFVGWSTTPDGAAATLGTVCDESFDGATFYAVWEKTAHPSNGNYNVNSVVIDFGEGYALTGSGNDYFTKNDGYVSYSYSGTAREKRMITPNVTGANNDKALENGGNALKAGTTYKVTLRLDIKAVGEQTQLTYILAAGNNRNFHARYDQNVVETALATNLSTTNGYQDFVYYITTPDKWPVLDEVRSSGVYTTWNEELYNSNTSKYELKSKEEFNYVQNRIFFSIYDGKSTVTCDFDSITFEETTATNLYVKENGEYKLLETVHGVPGEALTLPESVSSEVYTADAPTGSAAKTSYSNWYADAECTKKAVTKFANFDVDIYCDALTTETLVDYANQEIFVGFDTYSQRTEGLTAGLTLSTEDAYSGTVSLKAELASGASGIFELKNDHTLDLADGKTYQADLYYKSTAPVSLSLGIANGVVANGITPLASTSLVTASEWTKVTVVFTADGAVSGTVLAARLIAAEDAVVYVDTIIVSSVTGFSGATTTDGTDIRFMMSYTDEGSETVKIAGIDYQVAEHGVIIKGQDSTGALTVGSTDAGVYTFSQTDLTNFWSKDDATGETVYTAYVNGFSEDDTYEISARGYVKLANGTIFYTDVATYSVATVPFSLNIETTDADLVEYKLAATTLDNSVGKDAVNYIFITDIHYGSDDDQSAAITRQMTFITEMANQDESIDFVVVGGDLYNGTTYSGKANAIKMIQNSLAPLRNCTKPVFVINGNHDDNSYTKPSNGDFSKVLSDLDWETNVLNEFVPAEIVQDTERADTKYYYYDLDGKKTRIICLDSSDYNAKYDAVTGEITQLATSTSGDYYHGWSYSGFSASQMRWLAEDALGTLPSGYEVIFFCHAQIDKPGGTEGNYFSEELRSIISAFQSGSSYSETLTSIWGEDIVVSANFSGKSADSDVLIWQYGHTHLEVSFLDSQLGIWNVNTPAANFGKPGGLSSVSHSSYYWRRYARAQGTEKDGCFNVMSVSDEEIYRMSVGVGNNELLVNP